MGMAKRYVDFCKRRDALVLLLADNHECAVPRKGHMMLDQNLTPQEQLDYGCELFWPIRKQVIGACTGNHAARALKDSGLEMDKIMADRLGYSKNYFPWQGFVSAKVGKKTYKIAFKHGNGSGSDTFRNAKTLSRAFPTADICATSHTHQLAHTQAGFWDVKEGRRVGHWVHLISTGSLLNFPNYADQAYYAPQPKGFAISYLYPDEHRVDVDTSGKI